jgi:hypothetical protein
MKNANKGRIVGIPRLWLIMICISILTYFLNEIYLSVFLPSAGYKGRLIELTHSSFYRNRVKLTIATVKGDTIQRYENYRYINGAAKGDSVYREPGLGNRTKIRKPSNTQAPSSK